MIECFKERAFIDLVKKADEEGAWIHIHCHAGKGRTAALLVAYDMMHNPEVPVEDICARQAMLGGSYLLQRSDDPEKSWKVPLYEEKIQMVGQFHQYVAQTKDSGFDTPWSTWLGQQGA